MMNPAFFMLGMTTAQYDLWKRSSGMPLSFSFVISVKTSVAVVIRLASESAANSLDAPIKNDTYAHSV
jgi:hypothetical protein